MSEFFHIAENIASTGAKNNNTQPITLCKQKNLRFFTAYCSVDSKGRECRSQLNLPNFNEAGTPLEWAGIAANPGRRGGSRRRSLLVPHNRLAKVSSLDFVGSPGP